jgi:uncharacterized repeat protein (TIGR03803 family)
MCASNRLRDAGITLVCLWVISGGGTARAQSATLLTLDFYGPPGGSSFVDPLVVGGPAGFYGVDYQSVVFSMSAQGAIAPIYSLSNGNPVGPLVLANDGNLYGTTAADVASGLTTVFRVTPAGVMTVLYSYNIQNPNTPCTPGFPAGGEPWPYPMVPLIQGSDGNLYGTGADVGPCTGTVFKLTLDGELTVLYEFSGPDGTNPWSALVEGSDGNFYGTTLEGGANNLGTVFKITPAGVLTTLHAFAGDGGAGGATSVVDGSAPMAALLQGSDGNFYGTTASGGANNAGTIFSITPAGAFSLLYSFSGQPPDGAYPNGLTRGSDGNFYGTTEGGRIYGGMSLCGIPGSTCPPSSSRGTVFMITPGGTFTTLYEFSGPDGQWPLAPLVQGADGNFYGTTSAGGASNDGTVFKVSTGLESAAYAVPPPPGNVTYSVAGGSTTVSWSAVPGAMSYNVYANESVCAGTTPCVPVAKTTATSVTLTGMPSGIQVAWVNASGTSGLSAPATAGTDPTSDPPASGGGGALDLWMLIGLGGAAFTATGRRHSRRVH